MPIYVYQPVQGDEGQHSSECCFFESLQSMNEPSLTHCPTCGHPIEKGISSFSFNAGGEKKAGPQNKRSQTQPIVKTTKDTSAQKSVRLAMNHICGLGCRH